MKPDAQPSSPDYRQQREILVWGPEDYFYSSAIDYAGGQGSPDVELIL